MASQGIHAEKLTPHIGAVVHGVDLTTPLDEGTFKAIHDCCGIGWLLGQPAGVRV